MKKLAILGSTGSIGTQTLEVLDGLGDGYRVEALTAGSNITLLESQARRYSPKMVAVMDADAAEILQKRLKDTDIDVRYGMNGIIAAATFGGVGTVVNALVGNIGLQPTITAIECGKDIALANKETLVTAGEIITRLVAEKKTALYPIDSEHSAIFQCLQGHNSRVDKIYLTASGGPFRGRTRRELAKVTAAEALKHPNWTMGAKITIDSATMMNKGLEVIEARWLFGTKRIEVLVHPQSVIHSMVEFCDGAVLAQLGEPDMRVPISYALTYPLRVKNNFPRHDFLRNNQLTFEPPDLDSFPCLGLAVEAADIGGTMPTVMNAANEIAVAMFLNGEISFLQIPGLIEKAMQAYTVENVTDVPGILRADAWGRDFVKSEIRG